MLWNRGMCWAMAHKSWATCRAGEAGRIYVETFYLALRFGQSEIRVCGRMGMVDS